MPLKPTPRNNVDILHPLKAGEALLLPLASEPVVAGFPSPAEDHMEGALDLNEHLIARPASTFLVRAKGDSMINAHICDQDLLVVDRAEDAKQNRIVVAIYDGEFTLKTYCEDDKRGIWLRAENDDFPDIVPSEGSVIQVWGVLRHSIRTYL